MARTKKKNGADAAPMTTSQMLGSLLKSARDIMRKDKGLNGDLDRLPLLTWIMFLKFLDDLEQQREEEAALSGKKFKAAIEAPYRWRDWAADPQGVVAQLQARKAIMIRLEEGQGAHFGQIQRGKIQRHPFRIPHGVGNRGPHIGKA